MIKSACCGATFKDSDRFGICPECEKKCGTYLGAMPLQLKQPKTILISDGEVVDECENEMLKKASSPST